VQKDLYSLPLSYPTLSDFVISMPNYLAPSLEHNRRGVRFHTFPQSLSSSIWVIVNMTALALDNANSLCCKPTILSRIQAFRLDNAHLLSSLHP